MTALSVSGVTKSFGSTRVLHGIDLEVAVGSFTAILGPSGCGKTTLLRLIAGFSTPDSGSIRLGGVDVFGEGRSVPPQRRRVGYVPQEGALFPHLDVAANIAFGLPRKVRRSSARIDELLDLVDMPSSMRTRFPHELSGGQQQRVALARALAPEPSVVLLDEPFASLDAGLRQGTARAVAQALRAAGVTAVLVTHDQDEALSLADEVAVMRAGYLVQIAAPQSVYETPVDVGVAEFVGAAVILDAAIENGNAQTILGIIPVRGDSSADTATRIMVRPEQLRLSQTSSDSLPSDSRPSGRVTDVSYFGHDAFVRIAMQPDGPVVLARVMGGELPAVDATVTVTVDGTAALVR